MHTDISQDGALTLRLWILIIAITCGGCGASSTYKGVAEELVSPEENTSWVYHPRWVPIDDESLCHLPYKGCDSAADLNECVSELGDNSPFPGHTKATIEIIDCMSERGWELELNKSLVIILQ